MSSTYDIDRVLDQWFLAGSTTAPHGSIDRAIATALEVPQVRPGPARPRWIGDERVRGPLLAFAAVVAIVAVVGLVPRLLPTIVGPPNASSTPSVSATPTPGPSSSTAPEMSAEPSNGTGLAVWSEPFVSERYGYSIRYPAGWRVEPAPSDTLADTITTPEPWTTTRLSIVRRSATAGATFADVAEAILPHRSQSDGCHWGGGGTIYIPGVQHKFDDVAIAGRPALVRSECSFVDAIVDLGDEVLVVILRSQKRMPTGDGYTFASFVETLAIADDVGDPLPTPASPTQAPTDPGTAWTETFTSTLYRYTILFPDRWTPNAAASEGVSDVIDAGISFPYRGASLSIIRKAKEFVFGAGGVASPVPLWQAAGDLLPDRREDSSCSPPPGSDDFVADEIDRLSAMVRVQCGFVDAIVDTNHEFLIISLSRPEYSPSGDRTTFDRFMETIAIEDAFPPTKTPLDTASWTPFTSKAFGYSLRLPFDWIEPQPDEFERKASTYRLTVAELSLPAGMTVIEWADANIPDRNSRSGSSPLCKFGSTMVPPGPATFRELEGIDRPAAVRSACSVVDAAIDLGGTVLVLQLRHQSPSYAGDDALFDAILSTLALPEP